MDNCLKDSCHEYEWQATFPGILHNLKDNILSSSSANPRIHQIPKTLTTGASCVICVLLCFVVFAVAGSSITAFEYFFKVNAKRNEARVVNHAKKNTRAGKKTKGLDQSASNGFLGQIRKIFKCFCFVTNGRKILARMTIDEKKTSCLHGIRVIHFCWAVFVHTSTFYIHSIKNLEDQGLFLRSWFIKAIMKGDYLNDAFFTLGGFLNAYIFDQDYYKNRGNIPWIHFYIKKIVRLTPLYMIVLGFYTFVFPSLGSGPVWPTYSTNPCCKNVWWWNLLFLNNFLRADNQCMVWTWYIANYFQLYCLSPLIMIPLRRWPGLGYILAGICIFASSLSSFLITKTFNLTTDLHRIGFHLSDVPGYMERSLETFNHIAEKPYTRANSYLIGILLGHYLSSRNRSADTKNSSVFLYCGWIFTATILWISFSALGNTEESLLKFAVFNGMRSLLYACGISWFIFVCCTGQAEFVNRCLSWHGFVVLSRLSYSAYLIHYIFLEYRFLNLSELGMFSFPHLVLITACVFIWAFLASIAVSALIEIPVSRLYSMVYRKQKNE